MLLRLIPGRGSSQSAEILIRRRRFVRHNLFVLTFVILRDTSRTTPDSRVKRRRDSRFAVTVANPPARVKSRVLLL